MDKSIDLFVPLYNSSKFIEDFLDEIFSQENIVIGNVVFSITKSDDSEKTISIIKKNDKCKYFEIEKSDFSHSLTRQKAIVDYCDAPIVVLLSQDIIFKDKKAISNLVNSIDGDVIYAYGKQVSLYQGIEKYTREKNYPDKSLVVSRKDVDFLQLRTFFASDAFSAINRDKFIELGGYDNQNMMMSEDMYYSYKVIMAGYKKAYCSDAIVYHSHKYSLKSLYKRYYQTGLWFSKYQQFNGYHSTSSGLDLAKYILKRSLQEFNIIALVRFVPDMLARYLGMKKGEKGRK